jgi:hypothetical protein
MERWSRQSEVIGSMKTNIWIYFDIHEAQPHIMNANCANEVCTGQPRKSMDVLCYSNGKEMAKSTGNKYLLREI